MKVAKALLIALAIILLLILNLAAAYGFFYQFVYTFVPEQEIAELGEEYQGALVLGMFLNRGSAENCYVLVQMASGETRLLCMQGSQYFLNRYLYLKDRVMQVPEERPYSCTVRTHNETTILHIDASNQLTTREKVAGFPTPLDALYSYLPFLLFIPELILGGVVIHVRQKRKDSAKRRTPSAPQ